MFSVISTLALLFSKRLAILAILGLLGFGGYLVAGLLFGFIAQVWPVIAIVVVAMAFIGPEVGRLRYTMERSHTNFMTQVRGVSYTNQDTEPWDSYYVD